MRYASLNPALFSVVLFCLSGAASAESIVANCTGMVNFDIYTIDTQMASQEVENIGMSDTVIDDEAIVLTGDFGEYRFDLNVGTLYHNGSDTGVYCTYSTKD